MIDYRNKIKDLKKKVTERELHASKEPSQTTTDKRHFDRDLFQVTPLTLSTNFVEKKLSTCRRLWPEGVTIFYGSNCDLLHSVT